jgi:hypothetical protein
MSSKKLSVEESRDLRKYIDEVKFELDERIESLRSNLANAKQIKESMEEKYEIGPIGLLDEPSLAILKYIKDNQDRDQEITKEEISRYMNDSELASRPTTLKIIDNLLKNNVITNAKRRHKARNHLTLNPDYGLDELELDILRQDIYQCHLRFKNLTNANEKLVDGILDTLHKAIAKYETARKTGNRI